jgi:hypothetical protein
MSRLQECSEVALEAESFPWRAATECGGIENDGIERFAALDEPAEISRNVVRNESVAFQRDMVEFEISTAALERGF